jgi:gamma-glutamylcyclotransferase
MNYFAYATNLSQKEMQGHCPGSKPLFRATLPNYKLVFSDWSRKWHGGTATIRRLTGEKVPGAVYECPEQDMRRLDIYEAGYIRLNVTVFDEDGNPVKAVTYIRAGTTEEAPPSKEYLSIIQQGYRDWGIT